MDLISSLLPLVAIFAVFWFLLIRPQQRRLREQTERINSLEVGTRVMTTSGIYGTVRHLGRTQAVVEIAPGVEMTIAKAAISQLVRAEDEEFEYEDADDAASGPDRPAGAPFETGEGPVSAEGPEDFRAYPRPGDDK
nr:preprotein translocase subunit YajC [Propionibacterium sp.]